VHRVASKKKKKKKEKKKRKEKKQEKKKEGQLFAIIDGSIARLRLV